MRTSWPTRCGGKPREAKKSRRGSCRSTCRRQATKANTLSGSGQGSISQQQSGVDVKRTYRAAAVDVPLGRIGGLQGLPREGPELVQSRHSIAALSMVTLL